MCLEHCVVLEHAVSEDGRRDVKKRQDTALKGQAGT